MVNFYAICGSEILAGVFFRDRSEMRVRATLIDSVLLETKHIFSNFVQKLYEVINMEFTSWDCSGRIVMVSRCLLWLQSKIVETASTTAVEARVVVPRQSQRIPVMDSKFKIL